MSNYTPAPTPKGYESANSCEIPFPCREHAEIEALYLNENMSSRFYDIKEFNGKWYVYQKAWRSPVIINGKTTHIDQF